MMSELLAAAAANAHDRYVSQCSGGAEVVTDCGKFYGATLQSMAYPLSICPLRGALANAVFNGAKRVLAARVLAPGKEGKNGGKIDGKEGEKGGKIDGKEAGLNGRLDGQVDGKVDGQVDGLNGRLDDGRLGRLCGTCLEFLAEFAGPDCPIELHSNSSSSSSNSSSTFTLQQALPLSLRETEFLAGRSLEQAGTDCGEFAAGEEILPSDEELYREALRACARCYTPLSHYPVGAAVRSNAGVFAGANVETSAMRAGLCAEACALHNAVAAGATEISDIALVCAKAADFSAPCGGCRQLIWEWPRATVHSLLLDRNTRTYTVQRRSIASLLPGAFTL